MVGGGDKNLVGEESTREDFSRWGEDEQILDWWGGTPHIPPSRENPVFP